MSNAKGLHIGIIMDGNGRWASAHGLTRSAGHIRGAEVFQDIVRYCNELELSSVSFYAFSTENWKRPKLEIASIMKLLKEYLHKAFEYKKENNKVVFLGDRTPLSGSTKKLMQEIEEGTRDKTGMVLNIAINYGGRQEIVNATRNIANKVLNGEILSKNISEEMLENEMYTKAQKELDFILRPSGEQRLSNFLLWQSAYAELIFMDVLWPDFTREHLDIAVAEFKSRTRRFGGIM